MQPHEATEEPDEEAAESALVEPERRERATPSQSKHLAHISETVARLRLATQSEAHQQRLTEERAAEAVRQAARRARRLDYLAKSRALGLPPDSDLRDVVLDDSPGRTNALVLVSGFVRGVQEAQRRRPHLLVVAGPPGTGKTAAVAWGLVRLVEPYLARDGNDAAGCFVSADTIAMTPRGGWGETFARWERWLNVPVLAIDDLGTEAMNPEHLLTLLTERYNRTLVTLATSNLNRSNFTQRYASGRLEDRTAVGIEQRGRPEGVPWFVVAKGPSLRDRTAREALCRSGAL